MPLDGTATNRRPATEAAMSFALALAEAAGYADWRAGRATVPFEPVLCNLRYRLLLYAACTRNPALRQFVDDYRDGARSALRAFRALRDGGC